MVASRYVSNSTASRAWLSPVARLLAPALPLALCDDIGQAAYDTEAVALAFVRLLPALEPLPTSGVAPRLLDDFRRSLLGPIALELPESIPGLRA